MMKKLILFLTIGLFAQTLCAQMSSLAISSRLDVPFTVFIDEVLQNDRPVFSIAINDIPMGSHKVTVVLDDPEHHYFGQQLYLNQWPTSFHINKKGNFYGWETTNHGIRPELIIPFMANDGHIAPHTPYSVMSDRDFRAALQSLGLESYDNTRLTLAKQIASKNLLKAAQVMEICKLFSFESNKVEFAKFAYPNCRDKNNYYLVNSAFSYDASKRDLDVFIKGQK